MQYVQIEKLTYVTRVTIPRTSLDLIPNITLILEILGSLTTSNAPVQNTEEYVIFNYNKNIPTDVLIEFMRRWGVYMVGYKII